MATTLTVNGTVTLDESAGLQNSGTAVGTEDNNDSDVSLATLQANAVDFYNRLFNTVATGGLNLNSTFDTDNGVAMSASNFISVSSTGTVIDLGFVNGSGGAIPVYAAGVAGTATGLTTTSGDAISLFLDPSLGNDMVLGVVTHGTATTADDTIAFALYLQPTNGTNTTARVWMAQFTAITNPNATNPDDQINLFDSIGVGASVSTEFNFDSLPSGSNLFGIVGDSSAAMVVFGRDIALKADNTYISNQTQEVKTSQAGPHATIGIGSQMFDPGDAAYFTFVSNPDPNFTGSGLGSTEADDADNILYGATLEANSAFARIAQLQSGSTASMSIKLFNIADAPQGVNMINARGVNAAGANPLVSDVRVYDANDHLVESYSSPVAGNAVTISIVNGVATVTGFGSGYKIEWDGSQNFDQVLISGVAGKFDIGGIGLKLPSTQSVDIGAQTQFEDDGPSTSLSLKAGATLVVDETVGANPGETEGGAAGLGSVTGNAVDLFESNDTFGTDGAGPAGSTTWSLSAVDGTDSGVDTTDGTSVLLYKVGGDVFGRTSAGGADVFKISIDSSTGAVTLTQYAALNHPDATDPDEAGAPLSLAAGVVAAVREIKDGDLDPAHDDADLGPALKFEDDGPSTSLSLKSGAKLVVDETVGANAGETEGGSSGLGSVTGNAVDLFDTNDTFGSDGAGPAGSTTWSLSAVDGTDSGVDTTDGTSVLVYKVGNDVIGRTSAGGADIFKISINSSTGAVTLTQYAALKHPDATDPDEAAAPLALGAGVVAAVREVKDGDLDPAHDDADLGPALMFEDDGPSTSLSLKAGAKLVVDETVGANAGETEGGSSGLGSVTGNAVDLFDTNDTFGSDGAGPAGTTSWSLSATDGTDSGVDTTDGTSVLVYKVGNDIVGRTSAGGADIFKVSINASTGAVTLTQYAALKHPDATDPDEAGTPLALAAGVVAAVREVKDGDLDPAHDDADLGPALMFEDDGPSTSLSLKAGAAIVVDESLLANAGEDETGSLGAVSKGAAVLFDTNDVFGSDGAGPAGSTSWSLSATDGTDSGVDTTDGSSVLLYKVGNDVVGRTSAAGPDVFKISIDSGNGAVTLTQYAALKHPVPTDPDEANAPLTLAAGAIMAVREIKDGDLDPAHDDADLGIALKFEDDGPSIGSISNGLVDFAINSQVTNSLNGAIGQDANASPYIVTAYDSSLTIDGVTLHGVLSANGQQVSYWADTGGNGTFGDAGDTEYYRLTLNESGAGSYLFKVLVDPPPTVQDFNFDTLPSGSNLFGIVGDSSAGLVIFGRDIGLKADHTYIANQTQEIKTSQAGPHATIGIGSQMFDPGDAAYFTFVTNPDPNFTGLGLGSTEADDADNILYGSTLEQDSAFLRIAQLQSGTAPSMSLQLFNITGSPQGVGMINARGTNAAGTHPDITDVRVFDASGNFIESYSAPVAGNAVSISIANGVATVTGFGPSFKIEWDSDEHFDQVLVSGVAGKFDIGGIGFVGGNDTPDQLLHFTAKATDGDGDNASASWLIGIDGTGANHDGSVLGL